MVVNGAGDGPVVAAVDGSEHSLKALEWALREARAARAEVVVAHVLPDHAQFWHARRTSVVGEPPLPPADPVGDYVRKVLKDRQDLPPVRYESLTGGSVSDALDARAEGARVMVLGSRGRGGFTSLLLGSISRACATTAPCPVVVVPHTARAAGVTARGGVVLGLNPSETADEVVEFAFRHAALHGLGLTVMTAFTDPVSPLPLIGAPMAGVPEADAAPLLREVGLAQQERLAPFAAEFPRVRVENVVGPGDSAGQLVDRSEKASLLVVGRHRRRLKADSLLMGSVANAALVHASCPVAVVPGPPRST
ncbi:universal stress protein [Streptomyces sp. NPDC012888]|uniref:universal stress protein n=1 Tax=Streptomyces sp. NPDC012888 TaxID=3364855 RepID=UPI003685A873